MEKLTKSILDYRLIEETVEKICVKGCQSVRDDIASLENGHNVPETAAMTQQQQVRVLAELQSIMSVYGDKCRVDFNLNSRVAATEDSD